jgi:hypothetical protein
MRKPCSNCPFRSDRPFGSLGVGHAENIANALDGDGGFHCHKTLGYDSPVLCVGAAIYLEQARADEGGLRANLTFRLAVMTDELSLDGLSNEIPVYKTREEFLRGVRYTPPNS